MSRPADEIRADLGELAESHATLSKAETYDRLLRDVEPLLAENARLRADLVRCRALAWREAAFYLGHHGTPQHRAAEMLYWYTASFIDLTP